MEKELSEHSCKGRTQKITVSISVALCTYNGENFLREQLNSISQQTQLPDEVIICDDGSIDRTSHIIKAFSENAPFLVRAYRNSSTLGSTRNFEKAIGFCEGDVIVLADQDDVWRHDKIERIGAVFAAEKDCVGVFSDARLVDADLNDLGQTLWQRIGLTPKVQSHLSSGGEGALCALLKKNYITGATFAFRSTFLKHVMPIPRSWVHDAWIALLLAPAGKILALPETLIDYRQHTGNQIGIRRRSLVTRASDHEAIQRARDNLTYLIDHVEALEGDWPQYMTKQARYKMAHLCKRIGSGTGYGCSMVGLALELLFGRYHRYSNGFQSFVKDVMRLSLS